MERALLKPHKDKDFVDNDKVFIRDIKEKGSDTPKTKYFILSYEQEVACWVLVPYTDKTFGKLEVDEEGRTVAEPLFAFGGYDVLNRCDEFELSELE